MRLIWLLSLSLLLFGCDNSQSVENSNTESSTAEYSTVFVKEKLLELHNDLRRVYSREPLRYSEKLEGLAKLHAEWLANDFTCSSWIAEGAGFPPGYSPHHCPGEPSIGERKDSLGLNTWAVAENLHSQDFSFFKNLTYTLPIVGWMNSPPHKDAMLRAYNLVGFYWAVNPKTNWIHYVAVYGRECNGTPISGLC